MSARWDDHIQFVSIMPQQPRIIGWNNVCCNKEQMMDAGSRSSDLTTATNTAMMFWIPKDITKVLKCSPSLTPASKCVMTACQTNVVHPSGCVRASHCENSLGASIKPQCANKIGTIRYSVVEVVPTLPYYLSTHSRFLLSVCPLRVLPSLGANKRQQSTFCCTG